MRRAMTLLLAAGCTGSEPRVAERPSVLLLTLEGVHAAQVADSPSLDQLASHGSTFVRAYTATPLVLPSLASIHTGKLPPSHGVRDDGDFLLDPGQPVIAERLQAAGWHTLALTTGPLSAPQWGLHKGFDEVAHQSRWTSQGLRQRLAHGAQPSFTWVHLGGPFDEELTAQVLDSWHADHPQGLIVVTATHGPSDASQGLLLTDDTLHVPLLLAGPGLPENLVAPRLATHVDIVPTLLHALDLPPDPEAQGEDLFAPDTERVIYHEALLGQYHFGFHPLYGYTSQEGRYLSGAWSAWYPGQAHIARRGTREAAEGPRGRVLTELTDSLPPTPETPTGSDTLLAARLCAAGPWGGDPLSPPGEVDPRDGVPAAALEERVLNNLDRGLFHRAGQAIEELKGDYPNAFATTWLEMAWLRRQGRLLEAAAVAEERFLNSRSLTLALHRADLAAATAQWPVARSWYDAAAMIDPEHPSVLAGQTRTRLHLLELQEAEALYAQLLINQPDSPAQRILGIEVSLARPGAPLLRLARQALQLTHEAPQDPASHRVYGLVLWQQGQSERAIEAMYRALQLDVFQVGTRSELAVMLLETQRIPEAQRVLAPALRLLPDHEGLQRLARSIQGAVDVEQIDALRRARAHNR